MYRTPLLVALALVGVTVVASCSSGSGGAGSGFVDGGGDASLGAGDKDSGGKASGGKDSGKKDGGIVLGGNPDASVTPQVLDVEPSTQQSLTVKASQTSPTVTYKATLGAASVNVGWGVDKGNVGSIPAGPSSSAIFTPTGTTGGLVTITAGLNGKTLTRQVLVKLTSTENGPTAAEAGQVATSVAQLTAGGGVGGVGGEGLGTTVTDAATLTALGAPSSNGATEGLTFLYPYDKTVWPRGLVAPLLMWTWSIGDADAIQVSLRTTTGSFSYTGTFGRPAILSSTGGKFIRMPIPQDVWDMATNTAGGTTDQLTLGLTVAKAGVAYGPITETFTIAEARLAGTIYYNSYGTQLAQNFSGAVGGNGMFGGAVLSIHVGDTAPKLAAGSSGGSAQCRVCHSVAANGSRLVVQHGDSYGTSSAYDLDPTGNVEHVMVNDATFPGVYPDGSLALTEGGLLLPLPTDTTPIPTTGLTSVVTDLGDPAFSPDGTMIVFNPLAGPGVTPSSTLYTMAFAKATGTFSAPLLVAQETSPARPGWPAFFPDSKSIIYHRQTVASSCDGPSSIVTRSGARAQIYWTSLSGPSAVTPLDQLNGKGYLPKLAQASTVACSDACGTASSPTIGTLNADHSDDVDVNYEPTVNPVASGGYAWVVFTSRRMYGSVATIGSFCSDPRGVDLIDNITPKKLWVAAIDLSQAAGVDSSHPAFYLPAQELLAGNARGFWSLDPCEPDGTSCTSGDQCCNGYCEAGDGGLVCANTSPSSTCSALSDKCTKSSDCCDPSNECINGFCSQSSPP
jgi:hypothetical protein